MSIDQFSTDLTEQLWWAQSQQQTMMEQNPNAHPSPKPHKFLTPHPNSSWPPSHLYHHHRQQQSSWLSSYNPQEPPPSIFSTQIPSLDFDLNHEEIDEDQLATVHEDEAARQQWQSLQQQMEKEPMFEKPLTPSDVGKLNRLVIPKQHAENYFPLSGGDSGDKGLLLSFEDESGKCWRFRYSYWNSSQSYVLTKGWSRYVKEKQLDAGDVVFFERHRIDGDRLFIGWRRRVDSSSGLAVQGSHSGVWGRGLYSSGAAGHQPYPSAGSVATTTCVPYHPDCVHAGPVAQNQTAITVGNSRRRLRLFGVNLECQLDESEPSTPDGSSVSSSQGLALQQLYSQSVFSSDSPDKQMMVLLISGAAAFARRTGERMPLSSLELK